MRKRRGLLALMVLSLALLLLVWIGIAQSLHLESTSYDVRCTSANGAQGFLRIVHLSDLHSASFGKDNADLLALVASKRPDLIVFTGDLVDTSSADDAIGRALLLAMQQIAPVYYALGNHEIERTDTQPMLQALTRGGVHVLDNVAEDVTVRGMTVRIAGATTPYALFDLCARYSAIDLLLCHYPHRLDLFAASGIPLTFAGHAHGGQFRIPRLHTALYAPGQGVFPKRTEGVHRQGESQLVISRGLGNSSFPFRMYNPPEVVVVNLTLLARDPSNASPQ